MESTVYKEKNVFEIILGLCSIITNTKDSSQNNFIPDVQ